MKDVVQLLTKQRVPVCIIGTDTNIGKTYVCCKILARLQTHGLKALALKPVASGMQLCNDVYANPDVHKLMKHSNVKLAYDQVNPFAFIEAVAPHIAAHNEKTKLSVEGIILKISAVINNCHCDSILIEGVGGLMVPLNEQETYLDLLINLDFPVVLVVGMRLGCLNHALLTMHMLTKYKINLIGWVANCLDPTMQYIEENIAYLTTMMPAPLLAMVPYV